MPELNDVLRARILEVAKDRVAQHHGDKARSVSVETASIEPLDDGASYHVTLQLPDSAETVTIYVAVEPDGSLRVRG